jgi:hypothetical protein
MHYRDLQCHLSVPLVQDTQQFTLFRGVRQFVDIVLDNELLQIASDLPLTMLSDNGASAQSLSDHAIKTIWVPWQFQPRYPVHNNPV